MNMMEIWAKIGKLAADIQDIETQIKGLSARKKVLNEEIAQLRELLREKARNGEVE